MSQVGHKKFELAQPVGRVLRRILALARPYRLDILGGVALGVFISGLGFFMPVLMGEGVNKLLEAFEGGVSRWKNWEPLLRVIAAMLGVGFLGIGCHYANRMLMAHLRMKILTDLRRRVYRKLIRQSFSYYDKQDTGQLINRTIGDVNNLRMFYTMILVRGTQTLFSIVFFAVFLVLLDRHVALVALPFLPVYLAAMIVFARRIHPMFHEMRHELDVSTQILSENVQGMQVVRAFGRETEEVNRYDSAIEKVRKRWFRLADAFAFYRPSVFFLGELLMLAMVATAAFRVLHAPAGTGPEAGIIVTVYFFSRMLTGNMQFIARMAGTVQHSLVSAERVFEILDARPEVRGPGQPQPMPEGGGRVVFEDVTFGYDDEPVLENVNLDIPAGTNVALVGPTGCGKSTLIKLLPRFYDPQKGRILIDGADIRELNPEQLRAEIGFVFQDTFLFSASLSENIAFGVPAAERRAIEDVARRASVDEFAKAFTDGYSTNVGDRGVSLSGGQRQRVAIARALLVDPRILILDDATASVDSATERAIQDALAEVMEDRTTFIIAHRASTVRRADLILVMEEGRIVQQGKHEELIAREGPYREFCRMQWELGLDEEARP